MSTTADKLVIFIYLFATFTFLEQSMATLEGVVEQTDNHHQNENISCSIYQ